jgi:hypothetical protein
MSNVDIRKAGPSKTKRMMVVSSDDEFTWEKIEAEVTKRVQDSDGEESGGSRDEVTIKPGRIDRERKKRKKAEPNEVTRKGGNHSARVETRRSRRDGQRVLRSKAHKK